MLKGDMFFKLLKNIMANEFETEVYVTNNEMDNSVVVNNLLTLLKVAPQYADQTTKEIYDLMGLAQPKPPTAQQLQGTQAIQQSQGAPQGQGQQQLLQGMIK
jgi:hypothetical protein